MESGRGAAVLTAPRPCWQTSQSGRRSNGTSNGSAGMQRDGGVQGGMGWSAGSAKPLVGGL